MPDEVYVPAHPGDILTAANWNQLQAMIKADIQKQVQAAVDQLKKGSVAHADNSDKVDDKTPQELQDEFDQRYAPHSLVFEGIAGYRRYIKEFSSDLDSVFLRHELGRFPLVDICVLRGVPGPGYHHATLNDPKDLSDKKLLVYYGDEDADDYDLLVRQYRDQPEFLGVKLPKMLDELKVRYNDQRNLADVVNDMWEALFKDPNDEISHDVTPWVRDAYTRGRTVGSLRQGGEWDDLRVGIRAERIDLGLLLGAIASGQANPLQGLGPSGSTNASGPSTGQTTGPTGPGPAPTTLFVVRVFHVNYNTVQLQVIWGNQVAANTVDLMILMRG